MFDFSALPDISHYLPAVLDGKWVFVGAGGGIGAVVGLILFLPWILPRLAGRQYRFSRDDHDRLAAALPAFAAMDSKQRKRLVRLVREFLGRVRFRSRGGPVTPIMRVGIAGHACSLRLYGRRPAYPKLKTLWLDAPNKRATHRVAVLDERAAQLGRGGDRENVIVRQFAQRLFPDLKKRRYAPSGWRADWLTLSSGDASPPETFARCCEMYMQDSQTLAETRPDSYALLKQLLLVDPADPPQEEIQG